MAGHQALTTAQKIVVWAQGRVGRQVGKGECWDLAEQALAHAGAKTSTDLSANGQVGDDEDYVWGDVKSDVKDAVAGDIIQMRDYVVTTTTETEYTFDDGTVDTDTQAASVERPHHTAVVVAGPDQNGVIKTLEQNVKPSGKVVQNKKLYTRDVDPVVKNSRGRHLNPTSKKVENCKIQTTVTITVDPSGTLWIYSPTDK